MTQTTDNRIFIRTVARVSDIRALSEPVTYPHIFGDFLLYVPVLPDETLADVRDTLATVAEIHSDRLDHTNSQTRQPYTKEDWRKAVAAWEAYRPACEVLDKDALPFDEEAGASPTQWVVQVIAVDDEGAALDLYMEALSRLENGYYNLRGVLPESYKADTAILAADGSLYSRWEAFTDSTGQDPDTARETTLGERAAYLARKATGKTEGFW